MNSSLTLHVLASLRKTPLAVLALAAYVATSSSTLFPEDCFVITRTVPWFVSFFNGFDVALFVCLPLTAAFLGLRPSRQGTLFLCVAFVAIIVSLLASTNLPYEALFDALVHFLRFATVFVFASGSTRLFGPRQTESVFLLLYAILCASAIVVYQLTFETSMGRIYASGMGVGSFAQVSVVACIIAIVRRQFVVLAVSSVFLVLTFSVTGAVMFMMVVACIPLTESPGSALPLNAKPSMRPLQQVFVVGALVVGVAFATSLAIGDVGYNVGYNLKAEDAADGHGRKEIWLYALRLLRSGHVGVFGLGFFRTTGCFQDSQLLGQYADSSVENVHFHSIIFEGIIGLGVLSLPLFWMFFRRLWITYWTRQYLPCAIFLFFLLTLSVDFTMYRPKELIMWAFILGIADGQFREVEKTAGERREVAAASPGGRPRRSRPPVLAAVAARSR